MKYWKLFLEFFKIGLFTFGGGLSMIPLIQKTVVEKNKWITDEEMVDMIAISESTPGPIAINCATFIGYKVGKIWGGILATLGVVLPSFIIICIISIFYDKFIQVEVIKWAFLGIKAGVAALILNAGIKIFKKSEHNLFSIAIMLLAIEIALFTSIHTVFVIIFGLVVGVVFYILLYHFDKKKEEKVEEQPEETTEVIEEGDNI
jgi:chromate transporter